MKALEFLEDTVKYFSEDVSRRCVEMQNGRVIRCTYTPQNKNQTGCAIGRFQTPKAQKICDNNRNSGVNSICEIRCREDVKELLPEWMLNIDQYILGQVQLLHDHQPFWNEKGLTTLGKAKVEYISDCINKLETNESK